MMLLYDEVFKQGYLSLDNDNLWIFVTRDSEGKILEWDKISTFGVSILDQASKKALDLTLSNGHGTLQLIELVDRP